MRSWILKAKQETITALIVKQEAITHTGCSMI